MKSWMQEIVGCGAAAWKWWNGVADTVLLSYRSVDITVGKVLWVAVLLLLGRWLSRWGARWIVRKLPESVREVPELQARWARTLYLLFGLGFVLAAVQIMGIPLRTFSFLGGAVALGFGFGAQNLCANIISGVILKSTRPLKQGDAVEVDGRTGTVQVVGFRSTEILTFDGVHLEIPNSNLLSSTIVKRTTHTQLLRGELMVGVAYDSDTRLVERLLKEVVATHPMVVHEAGKTNRVCFRDFGPSALDFKVQFWVDTGKRTLDEVSGELRHSILERFRANGVEIPYPQMVVHWPKEGGRGIAEAKNSRRRARPDREGGTEIVRGGRGMVW